MLALLTVSVSARAAGEYELNDSRESAYGPLAGGTWYTAGTETINDYDWYVFYIKTYSQVEFSATAAAGDTSSNTFYIYDRDGKDYATEEGDFSAPNEEIDRLALTMAPGRYYVEVTGGKGARYKFRIDPAASLTTSRECGEAIVAKDLVAPQLADVNQELAEMNEKLATKVTAVHEAKQELRQDSEKAKRLKAKVKRLRRQGRSGGYLRQTSARLRQVRSEVQDDVERLEEAKEERQPYWEAKVNLETLAGQRQGELSSAEGQIAAHC